VTVPDELATGLGGAVRRRREELGLGQEQLAAALGVRQQTVSRWEHGLAVPRPGRVVELARVLALEPAALHRLAGYLPSEHPSAWDDVLARLPELARAELLLLVERTWEELRSRDGLDPEQGPPAAAVAG
jgi:transcriptional regulator with XRE-family HTH domain